MTDKATLDITEDDIIQASLELPKIGPTPLGSAPVPAFVPEVSPKTPPPPTVGGFRLVAKFSTGSATEVFLGYKLTPFGYTRQAVVKWVPRSRPGYEESRRVLLDEARAISSLDHPNVVKILDVGEDACGTYLGVEFVRGTDLLQLLNKLFRRGERLPVELVLYLVLEVLRGLHHAHSARDAAGHPLQIVHRDVNPSNVLVANTGHIKLTDFGIARMRDRLQAPTTPGMVKGKFRYLAPEYIISQTCTLRGDIYSTGVMLFELLTGKPWIPSRASVSAMRKIVEEGIPIAELETTPTPNEIKGIVALATDREPSRRFASAAEMCSAIEAWMIQQGIYVSPSVFAAHLRMNGLLPEEEAP